MKTNDFFFELPAGLVAQFPPERRGDSRLMVLNRASGSVSHHVMDDLPDLLERDSLLVFNDSRVRKARIFGTETETGENAEFLLLEEVKTPESARQLWKTLTRKKARRQSGARYIFPEGRTAEVKGWDGRHCLIALDTPVDEAWFERAGHIPLPPYIKRPDRALDAERYQTVYALANGAAAAPTAGLHFTQAMMARLSSRGIESAFITLHAGLGTFLPVYAENPADHIMHTEHYHISEEAADRVEKAKREKRPVITVGTTTLRALESAWDGGSLRRGAGSTSLFIYGDYHFNAADRLFTNFHTPESTLLMLAASFCGANNGAQAGRTMILGAYQEAIDAGYRFFSYGDAMFII